MAESIIISNGQINLFDYHSDKNIYQITSALMEHREYTAGDAENLTLADLAFTGNDGKKYLVEDMGNNYVISSEAGVVQGTFKLQEGEYVLTSENMGNFPAGALQKINVYLHTLTSSKKDQTINNTQNNIADTLQEDVPPAA